MRNLINSNITRRDVALTMVGTKCIRPGNSKLNVRCNGGTAIVNTNNAKAIRVIAITAIFFSFKIAIKFLVVESEVRIRNIFPSMSVEKAIALTSGTV